MKKGVKIASVVLSFIIITIIAFCSGFIKFSRLTEQSKLFAKYSTKSYINITSIPEFDGQPFVVINENQPDFSESDLTNESFEIYSPLDELGRCGVAVACIGVDIMPTEERGSIGQVKPSGWHTVKYDNVDGKYLYNRCHLIGYQLSGENANVKNLITGTRYLNNDGMLIFENLVADYVRETENHVVYRVTPIFEGDNLLASGVQMEAKSVEDNGKGICFNVYVYNAQPDIVIDYATGDSHYDYKAENEVTGYVLNTSSKKIHKPNCSAVESIKAKNKEITQKTLDELIEEGYATCGQCNP